MKKLAWGLVLNMSILACVSVYADEQEARLGINGSYFFGSDKVGNEGFLLGPDASGSIKLWGTPYRWDLANDVSKKDSLDFKTKGSLLLNDKGIRVWDAKAGLSYTAENQGRYNNFKTTYGLGSAAFKGNPMKDSKEFSLPFTAFEWNWSNPLSGTHQTMGIEGVPYGQINEKSSNLDGNLGGAKIKAGFGNEICRVMGEFLGLVVYGMKDQQGLGSDLMGQAEVACDLRLDPKGQWVATIATSVYGEKLSYKASGDANSWILGGKTGISIRLGEAK